MSKIDDLIKKLCPDGVEYKKVWEVTSWDKKYNAVEKSMQPRIVKYNYLLANQLNEIYGCILFGLGVGLMVYSIINLSK